MKIITYILFLLLASYLASAIGITPGKVTEDFSPGLERDVGFSVINSEKKDMNVLFYVKGDLGEHVTLNKQFDAFSRFDETKSYTYSIRLPERLNPGKHVAEIVALELPPGAYQQGTFVEAGRDGGNVSVAVIQPLGSSTFVGAVAGVITQFEIFVPYPGKFIEAELDIYQDKNTGKTIFSIAAISRGKLDIVNLKADIDIYTSLNQKVGTIETDSISLTSGRRGVLLKEWMPDVPPGPYRAVATVHYDENIIELEKVFNIGEVILEIESIEVKNFQLGGIGKFEVTVRNIGSSDILNAYLNIVVFNKEGETMADFKSPTYDVNALSREKMIAFWDTAGVQKGVYEGKIILHYLEREDEKPIQLQISEDSIVVIGATGRVVLAGRGRFDINTILVVAVLVLMFINIGWFVYLRFLKGRNIRIREEKKNQGVEIVKK
ncbi:hypothetical protein HYV49_04030 [Candidatus Pacearchaeota archaeon]|nr:hypothetical protein [Candidatus Pacearchaeota archaeon]